MSDDQHVDRARLGTAIRGWIERGKEVGEEISSIAIMHEGSSDPVDTIRPAQIPKDASSAACDDLIELIAKKIEGDARGFRGTFQLYFVEVKHGGHRVTSRETFGLELDEQTTRRGRVERPTDDGERALLMRLVDQMHARTSTRSDRDLDRADRRYEVLLKENENMRNELSAVRAAMDEMITDKETRLANAKAAEERAAMVREAFRDVKTYLPVLANRLAGNQIIPEGELAPEQRLLRELVRELDGPEVALMINTLAESKPRIGVMLAELVLKVKGEDERRDRVTEAAQKIIADAKPKDAPAAPKLNGSAAPKELAQAAASHRSGEIVPR